MLPLAQASCWPSAPQIKLGDWLGTQPLAMQVKPVPQVPVSLHRGTQAPSTHTVEAPPQSLVMVQAVVGWLQRPKTVLQE